MTSNNPFASLWIPGLQGEHLNSNLEMNLNLWLQAMLCCPADWINYLCHTFLSTQLFTFSAATSPKLLNPLPALLINFSAASAQLTCSTMQPSQSIPDSLDFDPVFWGDHL